MMHCRCTLCASFSLLFILTALPPFLVFEREVKRTVEKNYRPKIWCFSGRLALRFISVVFPDQHLLEYLIIGAMS